jgi:molybdopterin-guanine dinucleotide biosynthesis protein A
MYNDVTGIILAGGKSTRMGENKSFLLLEGISIIERVINLMQSIFGRVILITNTPAEYNFIPIEMYKDIYEYKGPLAGIHSGLMNSNTDENFIISCDIPLMSREMIEYIYNFKTSKPITVCKADGYTQQLAGRYSRSVLTAADNLLRNYEREERDKDQAKRKCKVLSLLDEVGTEIIDAEELDIYKKYLFYNMNRPEDYDKIKKLVLSHG